MDYETNGYARGECLGKIAGGRPLAYVRSSVRGWSGYGVRWLDFYREGEEVVKWRVLIGIWAELWCYRKSGRKFDGLGVESSYRLPSSSSILFA